GRTFLYGPPSSLVSAGDRIFFAAADETGQRSLLWVYKPGSGASIVEPKASNGYFNPQLFRYFDGHLYFSAESDVVTDLYDNPTNQPWVVDLSVAPGLPGDFNHDGTVDAADYVYWQKSDGSQAGYNAWRQNFGRTVATGAGSNSYVLAV